MTELQWPVGYTVRTEKQYKTLQRFNGMVATTKVEEAIVIAKNGEDLIAYPTDLMRDGKEITPEIFLDCMEQKFDAEVIKMGQIWSDFSMPK